ncbi:MAG: endolytic transglycosylase MltG [Elusimicrobiota bacterium]|jgi:UPF0755 protein
MRLKTLSAALVLGLCSALAWLALRPGGEARRLEIPPGTGAYGAAAILAREGVCPDWAFRAAAKLTGADRRLKPGVYLLRKGMGAFPALLVIREGRSERARIVVPEGFMAAQIAARLEENGVCKAADFMEYVRANNLEGYLFPTTYFFDRGTPAVDVAHHMHDAFRAAMEPVFSASPQRRFTLSQALTLAAIVQREAKLSAEMPTIAAVYVNRLDRRMRLQADPTVQYALGRDTGEWPKALRRSDLRMLSKYNTYEYFGLPPGPICSPGVEALKAALEPARTDATYFVADDKGGHIFSRTNEEHLQARAKVKRERRLQQK